MNVKTSTTSRYEMLNLGYSAQTEIKKTKPLVAYKNYIDNDWAFG